MSIKKLLKLAAVVLAWRPGRFVATRVSFGLGCDACCGNGSCGLQQGYDCYVSANLMNFSVSGAKKGGANFKKFVAIGVVVDLGGVGCNYWLRGRETVYCL